MPFKIQRVPRGLNSLLLTFGGENPIELEDRVRGALELLQFYGLQQQQVLLASNAALAEGGSVSIAAANPRVTNTPAVLFAAFGNITKTATMTALSAGITVFRASNTIGVGVASNSQLGPFGATETGIVGVPWQPGYPWLLVPPWDVAFQPLIIGTDATANVSLAVEIGLLG